MLHGLSHFMACQGHQRFLFSFEPFVCNTLKSAVILKKSGTELTDEASSVIFLITLNMKQWNQILNNTAFCSVPCTVFSWDFLPKATVWHGIAYEMLLLTGWSFHNMHVSWLQTPPMGWQGPKYTHEDHLGLILSTEKIPLSSFQDTEIFWNAKGKRCRTCFSQGTSKKLERSVKVCHCSPLF